MVIGAATDGVALELSLMLGDVTAQGRDLARKGSATSFFGESKS